MSLTNCQKHNCDYHDELLTVYASGHATQQERQRVEKLLAQCPDCRRKVMELEQTWWALDIWEEDERQVPLHLTRFRARFNEVKTQQPVWQTVFEKAAFFFRPAQLVPAMSMAAVLIIASIVMLQPGMMPNTSSTDNSALKNIVSADTTQTIATATATVSESGTLESRFDYYVALSRHEQSKRTQRRNSNIQTVGYIPNKQILSSFEAMDERPQLRPGVIAVSQR